MLAAELLRQTSLDNQTLRALAKRGLVELREEAVARDPHADEQFIATTSLTLNPEQATALTRCEEALAAPENAKPIAAPRRNRQRQDGDLFPGDPCDRSLAGKQPSFSSRKFRLPRKRSSGSRAGSPKRQDMVAVLHSHLSEGERHDEWHKIQSGRARIVIGARSAVFAPLENLGLIVVDEEHETTYKQEEAPRYHARDVAVVRAKMEKCVVSARDRHAFARELSQCRQREVSPAEPDPAGRRLPDAADADRRFAAGAAERKGRRDPLRKTAHRDYQPAGETRTNHPVFQSARVFDLASLQRMRRSAQLPELQCRAHVPSRCGAVELSFMRAYRRRAEEMSGLRQGRVDLRRVRHREGGIERRADFSDRHCAPDGCRFHDPEGRLSRYSPRVSARARSTFWSARK